MASISIHLTTAASEHKFEVGKLGQDPKGSTETLKIIGDGIELNVFARIDQLQELADKLVLYCAQQREAALAEAEADPDIEVLRPPREPDPEPCSANAARATATTLE